MAEHTTDLIYEVWEPKCKWFRPPITARLFGIPLFRWAYRIQTSIFTNVYPAAIQSGTNGQLQSIEFDFTPSQFSMSPEIDAKASEIRKYYDSWLSQVKEMEDK